MIGRLVHRFRTPPACRQVAAILQSYLDGELPPSEVELVHDHLQHCERCGIESEIHEAVRRSLAELATPTDPHAVARLTTFAHRVTRNEPP
jgi:anti-sigma factor RsiW